MRWTPVDLPVGECHRLGISGPGHRRGRGALLRLTPGGKVYKLQRRRSLPGGRMRLYLWHA